MAYKVTYKDKEDQSVQKKVFTNFTAAEQEARRLDDHGHEDVVLESPRRKPGFPNIVGIMLKAIGVLVLAGGFLIGIVTGRAGQESGFDTKIAMEWWMLALMCAAFFYGMGEIVNLLDRISKKSNT
ncbi:hypothetical protein [Paenibacillus sp. J22TS3]|uniref:hypothetical protein n=1 Tax=Paenibacillus sp. J22TS3 TaxID=2807192 RepID=UPI001B226DE4|nr:hypothetical protein [Paenibacillus sp. J22TS3]GIP20195.1 hypothetical protein J22TS3_04700 [Paenibacillus sp. J22TS3]